MYKTVTFVSKESVERVADVSRRHANVLVASVDVSTHDVVSIGNLFQGLGTGDDYFTRGENGCGDFFRFFERFEFYFHRRILVRLETD